VLLVAFGATGYLVYRHMSNNIAQVNLAAYIGKQPADLHPQAENILIIGSASVQGAAAGAAAGSQPGTLMLVHIAADKRWAEVMSIPPDSRVNIPARTTADVQLSPAAQSNVNQAYATGNRAGLGVAFTIRALERGTGIYVNHFIVVNSAGFKGMVAALGGVEERNQTAIDNPRAGLVLTPAQALAYAHGLLGQKGSSGQARTALQQALAVSLIARARGAGVPVLAVDTPTAVDLTSGDPSDPVVQADLTVTFHRPKTGLLTKRGAALAGKVLVAPIGIPPEADRG